MGGRGEVEIRIIKNDKKIKNKIKLFPSEQGACQHINKSFKDFTERLKHTDNTNQCLLVYGLKVV